MPALLWVVGDYFRNQYKKDFMKKHFLLIGSLLFSSIAFGQGYQLNLQGMKQVAMGGAGAAVPWDVSTVFYNPGALTSIRNLQVSGGATAMMPRTRFVSAPTGTEMLNAAENTYVPFNAYIGAPVAYKSPLSIGLGIYTPFGTGIEWNDDWTGRFITSKMRLRTTFFQPTVSYRLTDEISLGAGFVYARGYFEYNRALPLNDQYGNEARNEISGRSSGVGYNIGLHIRANDDVQFGITYRSQVNMKLRNGYAKFIDVPSAVSSSYISTAVESEMPMPQVATVGMGWNISETVTLQLEANYTGWAAYDSLRFDYQNNTELVVDEQSPRRYKNTVSLRAGVNYMFTDKISGMLGAAYEPSPVREGFLSPEMPDAKRLMASAGLSIQLWERLAATAMVQYSFSEVRTGRSTEHGFVGKYHTKLINPGIGIVYDFN